MDNETLWKLVESFKKDYDLHITNSMQFKKHMESALMHYFGNDKQVNDKISEMIFAFLNWEINKKSSVNKATNKYNEKHTRLCWLKNKNYVEGGATFDNDVWIYETKEGFKCKCHENDKSLYGVDHSAYKDKDGNKLNGN